MFFVIESSVTAVWQLCDSCLTAVWQQCDISVTAMWQQSDSCLAAAWQLCDSSVTAVRQQFDSCVTAGGQAGAVWNILCTEQATCNMVMFLPLFHYKISTNEISSANCIIVVYVLMCSMIRSQVYHVIRLLTAHPTCCSALTTLVYWVITALLTLVTFRKNFMIWYSALHWLTQHQKNSFVRNMMNRNPFLFNILV